MAIPFEGQAGRWSESYRARWQRCVESADVVTVLSHEYTKSCLFARNRYLVTQADLLLACYDGKEGGTKHTVEYAQCSGCPVCLIPPAALAQMRDNSQSDVFPQNANQQMEVILK